MKFILFHQGHRLYQGILITLIVLGWLFSPLLHMPSSAPRSPLFWRQVQAQEGLSPEPGSGERAGTDLVGKSASTETRLFLPLIQHSAQEGWHEGEGTYYDATGAGNCSFDPSPEDLMVAAMNHSDYANAAVCGAYILVEGPEGAVTVRIVDRCPECAPGDVDMSPEAFAEIADLAAGRVPIRWRIVSPELEGPIKYHFKEGSNQWWTAVQIRNHRNPISKVEYRLASGEFKPVTRTDYNYFVETSGMGPGPYTFRVTDLYGNVLEDAGIPHIEGGEVEGSGQFPPGP